MAAPGQAEFLVSLSPGVQVGMEVQTTTPDGQVLTFTVPSDYVEGQMIPVFYTPLQTPPQLSPPSRAEMGMLLRTFKDAKDRWKVDGQTLKAFYLHSESKFLYVWDQPSGILYEFNQSSGQCQAVWTSKIPSLNAQIWTVLPLPPTDPASLQSVAKPGHLPNIDAYLILEIAHEDGRQLPKDVVETAAEDFCERYSLHAEARQRLRSLPHAGQFFLIQNFRAGDMNPSEAFTSYVDKLLRRPRAPWGKHACTLLVHTAGAIIGRSCPDLDALCREDPANRLAQAHCKIKSDRDRYFVCDMNTSVEGTLLDGAPVSDSWVGPLKSGSVLVVGPLRIKIQLSEMALDTPIVEKREGDEEPGDWQRKVYQKTEENDKITAQRRQQEYRDRAEARRERNRGEAGSVAIDTLVKKFGMIQEAEKAAQEVEDSRIEMPAAEAQREANMAVDGSFLGMGDMSRAGIGFTAQHGPEFIPNVVDPKSLSARDASRLKTQMRYERAL